ncbi:hypothetical protein OL229_05155 [Neisseriaceae bacterium JH1-16]|nr:hypothetical protein [Neisseriaceae bacterium JH1-16]
MQRILKRLAEPSSAAGIGTIIGNVAALASGTPASIALPALLAGVVAVLLPERGAAL